MTGSKKTILLVEDEPAQSLHTQHSLEQEGFNVIPAFSGEEAIETASLIAEQIDLIIMDIDLGSVFDGTEAAKTILSSIDVPLLFLSSHTDPVLVAKTESISSYGYVIKGSFTVLLASIKMAFRLYEANQKLKHHEKLLKEREFWLNRSQNAASIGSFEITFQNDCWTCSPGLYKVFGTDESIPIGMSTWINAIHPDDRESVIEYFNKTLTEHGSFEKDYRIIRASDGAVRWIHGIGETEADIYGNLTKMFGIIQDITEQKASMEAFSNTQQQMLKLIEASNDWIWEVNEKGVYTYSSPQVSKILGYRPEDVIGKTPFDFMPPREAARVMEIFKNIAYEMKPFWGLENLNIHSSGRKVYIETNGIPKFSTNGEFNGFIGMDRDITERKIADDKLKKSERKYRDLFENNPEPTLIFDSETLMILDTNFAAVKKYGYSKSEFKELTILQLRPDEEREKLLVHLTGGKVQREKPGVWLHKKKNSELMYAEVTASDTNYEGRKARMVVAADVTERLKAEEKIKDSLKEKEILLSEIHHRVKNNLQVISSMLSLQADYISDAGTREHFKNSTNRIRTMALIHEKLYQSKDFSRIDIKEYLTDLTGFLFRSSVLLPGQVSLNITGENFNMPLDNAIPCGLIVNELVSNSLKYAFT
ncbi:MAG: PAS domain S-box protein, partial [Syntrophothermus sp.]